MYPGPRPEYHPLTETETTWFHAPNNMTFNMLTEKRELPPSGPTCIFYHPCVQAKQLLTNTLYVFQSVYQKQIF